MKNLLIKLNDIIVDVSANYDKAVKKSVEFFLGQRIDMEEINEFRKKTCPANNLQCINLFLNEKDLFLREAAIMKKLSEYYLGREFDGLIAECSLLIDKKKLDKLASKYNLILLSLMAEEETEFLINNLGIKFRTISSGSVERGIRKAKKKGKVTYLGNTLQDYKTALKQDVDFVGLGMDKLENGKVINKIEEIIN